DVPAALPLDPEGPRASAEGPPPTPDDRNLLPTPARPSSRVPGQWLSHAFAPHEPLAAFADSVDPSHLALRLYSNGYRGRARELADRLDPARRELVLGWLARPAHRPDRARAHFAAALAADPALEDAAIGLALVDPKSDTAGLPERARAVIDAQRSGDRAVARDREAALAQWQPGELLYPDAAELRVGWRLELGQPADLDA